MTRCDAARLEAVDPREPRAADARPDEFARFDAADDSVVRMRIRRAERTG